LPSRATASQPFEVSIGLTPRPKATKTEVSFRLMIVNDTDLFKRRANAGGCWLASMGKRRRTRTTASTVAAGHHWMR